MSTYVKYIGGSGLFCLGLTYVEKKILPSLLPKALFEASEVAGLPRAFGLVLLLLVLSAMWIVIHGLKVGGLRKKYAAKAEKDGEANVEYRYGLPNLYVSGMFSSITQLPSFLYIVQLITSIFPFI